MIRYSLYAILIIGLSASRVSAQSLAIVEDVEWKPLRAEVERLLKGLDALKSPLPAATVRGLGSLLERNPADAALKVQELLDAHCLVGVSINPESRVKVARGDARAELVRGQAVYFLVKIHNDAGVTHPLAVEGDHLRTGKAEAGRWLHAEVENTAPLKRKLNGQRLQYVVLRLTAHEAGKREATFRFDVGQGTQDLGFRAEVPVLFSVRKP